MTESTSFSDAMALRRVGDGMYEGELNKHWTIGPKLHGGVMLALCGAAAQQAFGHCAREERSSRSHQPVAVSASYLSAPNPGKVLMRTSARKRGRRVSVVDVELVLPIQHPHPHRFVICRSHREAAGRIGVDRPNHSVVVLGLDAQDRRRREFGVRILRLCPGAGAKDYR